jgi:hypothetical protein
MRQSGAVRDPDPIEEQKGVERDLNAAEERRPALLGLPTFDGTEGFVAMWVGSSAATLASIPLLRRVAAEREDRRQLRPA